MFEKIVFLTEGGYSTGFGHISRCSALAKAFKRFVGSNIFFLLRGDKTSLSFLKQNGFDAYFFDWEREISDTYNIINGASLVIVDSYNAQRYFYDWLVSINLKLLIFDDFFRLSYPVNSYILNPTADPDNNPYHLFGLDYIVLRPPFWKTPDRILRKEIKRVMITFGSGDIKNLIKLAIQAVKKVFPSSECCVVISHNFRENDLHKFPNLKFFYRLNARKMRDLMLSCDLAISASGQTIFELICTKTPSISVITAENQLRNAKILSEKELVYVIPNKNSFFIDELCELLIRFRSFSFRKKIFSNFEIVNGFGALKVIESLKRGN